MFLAIILISIFASSELELFVPSFPSIQSEFQISPFAMQLTLSLNFIAYCIFSLFVGSFSDKYDRRLIINVSLLVCLIGSIICVLTTKEYYILLIGRMLQGIGIAAPSVLSPVVISDVYEEKKKQSSLIGIMHSAMASSAILSPVVGSYVNIHFGWKANFIILLILNVFALIFSFLFIPSSKSKSNTLEKISYMGLLKSSNVLLLVIALSCIISCYLVFSGISPILYVNNFNVKQSDFGFHICAMSIAFALLSGFGGNIIKRFGYYKCLRFGIMICIVHLICLIPIIILNVSNPYLITACIIISSFGVVFPINIGFPVAINLIQDAKGKTAALLTAVRLLQTSFGLWCVSLLHNGTIIPLGIYILISMTVAICIFIFLLKRQKEIFQE
ncbi:MAG: MFS transporter [Proteobacteria bacterium]|nr:MFS transporter [Pseudomonadota bacterium]